MGWLIQGFIEDRSGRLRFNTYEETMFCMGCHNSVGSIIDKTYSFPRKLMALQVGIYRPAWHAGCADYE